MTLKETLHAASSMALILAIGFGFGWYFGHPGPLVYGAMENSTVNMTPSGSAETAPPYPCVGSFGGEVRCTFVNTNETWLCSSMSRDYPEHGRNETCREVSP